MVEQYYRMGEFKSAVVAAKNAVKLYPDTDQRETLEWIAVDAQYQYAENSVRSKRLERFQLVLENIQDYLYTHPKDSKHFLAVKKIESTTQKRINEIKAIL
jgi:outer membrane protein assembly factor BamD